MENVLKIVADKKQELFNNLSNSKDFVELYSQMSEEQKKAFNDFAVTILTIDSIKKGE